MRFQLNQIAAFAGVGLLIISGISCSGVNQQPTADAGPDQIVYVGETAQLNGSTSSDPEGNSLSAQWEFKTAPVGSQATFSDPTSATTSFMPTVPGVYVAQLTVDDGLGPGPSSVDTVEISTVVPLNFSGIAIDYNAEMRCSDNNWTTNTPVACNPQLSFTCPAPPPTNLSGCPDQCQDCYNTDLTFLKTNLGVDTILIYQPNYYILTAAQSLGIKVILGLFNDTVLALATPSSGTTSCTYAGAPALCGSAAVQSLIDGSCGATTPWNPATFCTGSSYITAFKPFFDNNTVIGVQLGNEILSSPVNGSLLTVSQVLAAAQTLRTGLNQYGYTNVPVIVSLVAGMEKDLCSGGKPMANIDLIASHPYCNFVASVPPTWPLESGVTTQQAAQACAQQVIDIFNQQAVANCGQQYVFIGETGYNTSCPGSVDEATHLAVAEAFFPAMVSLACTQNTPLFFFDYADECPQTGCLPGCAGGPNVGNGYFGIYYTQNYDTSGPLVLKFPSVPTLSCP